VGGPTRAGRRPAARPAASTLEIRLLRVMRESGNGTGACRGDGRRPAIRWIGRRWANLTATGPPPARLRTMNAMRIDENPRLRRAAHVLLRVSFPPRTPEGEANLYLALAALRPLGPRLHQASRTAQAARPGARRSRSSRAFRDEIGLEAMAHFTCVGATVDELRTALDEMAGLGFENVLRPARRPRRRASRSGRRPTGASSSHTSSSGSSTATTRSTIGGGVLPRDAHPRGRRPRTNLRYLKGEGRRGA